MINDGLQQPELLPSSDAIFPVFVRNNVSPDSGETQTQLSGGPLVYETGYICNVAIADEIVDMMRKSGESTEVQQHHDVPLTPKAPSASSTQPAANSPPVPKKKNKNDTADHQQLIDRLNKPPHVIEFQGVILDRNERLQIIAAIALCESGHDPFTAENRDTEFHAQPSPSLSYGRLVHIGLSYGIIQFTQDSGGLGKLLQRMVQKDSAKFAEVFGDNYAELITLTTTGVDVSNVDYASGQAHWNSIRHASEGTHLAYLAAHHTLPVSSEIRGRRVQPIAVNVGGLKQDLWEGQWAARFVEAGKVDAFQEAELEFAVEGYMNPALKFCKDKNIRSALGIAFVTACAIRGAKKMLITAAAKCCGVAVPFVSGEDEKRAVEYIAHLDPTHDNTLAGIPVQRDEIIRAKTLLKDETGFLAEDLYYSATYTSEYDH
ncbi:hypothetical protein [Paraburkholderia bryophila]|uniref:Uncharacterized protein n=1 Tax=Paraburkholderia bryophila TaxID=420952 RepID=A0A329BKD6_9BURK|nr:hypothetical protein [Paraburkholderia bryophila]RAS19455.1 hypothetical protein BX591_14113 [Paraburkholderia bryophila]